MKHTNKKLWALLLALVALVALCAVTAFADGETSGTCGENVTWSYDTQTKTLTVSGTGAMTSDLRDFEYEVQTVVVEEGITETAVWAFGRSPALTSVSLPSTLINLNDSSFEECAALEEIVIPNSVTRIGDEAFQNCTSLRTINIPNGITLINDESFMGCASLKTIALPEGITRICEQAFLLSGLESIELPTTLTSIGGVAFAATELESITIPNNVTSIGEAAFGGCANLTTVQLGTGLERIGYAAFNMDSALGMGDNNSLETIKTCMTSDEWGAVQKNITIEEDDASGLSAMIPGLYIYDPDQVTVCYDSHVPNAQGVCTVCGRNANIVGGSCGDNCTWTYNKETKTLTITGTGRIYDAPWEPYKNEMQKAVIGEGVTVLGSDTFSNCRALSELILPDSMEELCGGFVQGCASLKSITIPSGITKAQAAFMLSGVESVTFAEGLQRIGMTMFSGTGLKNVVIANSVKDIASFAFGACSDLETVHLGTGLERIGYAAFNMPYPGFGDNNKLQTIYTCMTDAEWAAVLKNVDTGETDEDDGIEQNPGLTWLPATAQVITNSHIEGADGKCTLCGRQVSTTPTPPHEHNYDFTWYKDSNGKIFGTGTCTGCGNQITRQATITIEDGIEMAVIIEDGKTYKKPTSEIPIIIPSTPTKSRCKMCDLYEEYKNVPFAGWIISIVHFFVHLASRI